ncbi:GNAT family N-acetyltransferase [Coralliovum pocilloporae]|uniref:GNAT family N-acetyltransferase n=1 Tax=Coralliovum pocilloporae TaxID=3066369 RepID=UPI0033079E0E
MPSKVDAFERAESRVTANMLGQHLGNVESFDLYLSDSTSSLEYLWHDFQKTAVMTPYQQFGWMDAWLNTIGAEQNIEAAIVTGFDNHGIAFILPLCIKRRGPFRVLNWIGGKHTNYNMGLYRRDVMSRLSAQDICQLLKIISQNGTRIDVVQLQNQPKSWNGLDNPFAAVPYSDAPSIALSVDLSSGFQHYFETVVRKRARKKYKTQTRKLLESGHSVAIRISESATDGYELFSIFLKQRNERFRNQGIQSPFGSDDAILFYLDLIQRSQSADKDLLTFYSLVIDGQVRAIFAGVGHRGRFSACITSFADDELAQLSPGEYLLHYLIQDRAELGDVIFDLGIGDARYKRAWCDTEDVLFDNLLPVASIGRLLVPALRVGSRLKSEIKNSRTLWSAVNLYRRAKAYLLCVFHPCDDEEALPSVKNVKQPVANQDRRDSNAA